MTLQQALKPPAELRWAVSPQLESGNVRFSGLAVPRWGKVRVSEQKGVVLRMMQATRKALRRAKDTEGFTLIELLVVVLILGILSAIVVVAVSNARSNAVVSACKADVVQVAKAAQQYYVDNGAWPASEVKLVDGATDTVNTKGIKYLNKLPGATNDAPTTVPTTAEYKITFSGPTTHKVDVTGGPTECKGMTVD